MFDRPELPIEDLRARAGQTVTLTIVHPDGSTEDIEATLRVPTAPTQGALGVSGLGAKPIGTVSYPPAEAVALGAQRTVDAFGMILAGLGDLGRSIVTDPTTAPPAAGPVGIAVQIGDVLWSLGPLYVLYMAGLLSANLALVNILPFPPLDGGRMLVILLKAIPVYGKRSRSAPSSSPTPWASGPVDVPHPDDACSTSRSSWWRYPVTSPDARRPVRRPTVVVDVGGVMVGSAHPVVVQSMTNTDTADAAARRSRSPRWRARAASWCGSRSTRTRRRPPSPRSSQRVRDQGVDVPIIGDFHYNGHLLLAEYPACAAALAKYRINPATSARKHRDENFRDDRPGRDRARQAGPHRRELGLARPAAAHRADGRERARAEPRDARDVMIEAMVESALRSAALAEETGLRHDRIILSAKVVRRAGPGRRVPPARRALRLPAAPRPDRGRHGHEGHRRDAPRASSLLLHEGIGDTIRVSLTPEPGGDREEVRVAQQILQSLGLRSFTPQVTACPGCGRTTTHVLPGDGAADHEHLAPDAGVARDAPGRRGAEASR